MIRINAINSFIVSSILIDNSKLIKLICMQEQYQGVNVNILGVFLMIKRGNIGVVLISLEFCNIAICNIILNVYPIFCKMYFVFLSHRNIHRFAWRVYKQMFAVKYIFAKAPRLVFRVLLSEGGNKKYLQNELRTDAT